MVSPPPPPPRSSPSFSSIPESALESVFPYLSSSDDLRSASLACKSWYHVDSRTRRHVTIACCYSIDPSRLVRRFHALESVKLKGKPRASMFKLIPENWGGYAKPWISVIAYRCHCLKSIHLRRMIVKDDDLFAIATQRGHMLQSLLLDKCSGFSTTGLEAITRTCRSLRVLFLDESTIEDKDGKWLHELAVHNSCLEVLNFYGTDLQNISIEDLLTITMNCKSLTSLKLNELTLENLTMILKRTISITELGGLCLGSNDELNGVVRLPSSLTSVVGLYYAGSDDGDVAVNQVIQPIASKLKKIDLQAAFLSVNGHCQILGHCSNLEALEVFNAIGDDGLEVIARNCKRLRRLRVERGDQEVQQGFITQKGLKSVALSCHQLEYIAAYVSDIDNAALVTIASNCPNLKDFRLVLLDEGNDITDYPLDSGVRSLMQNCHQIHRFALYLRPGCVTDEGMKEIGMYGKNLRWALFGLLGETDRGLSMFADHCPILERLEIRDCVYSEAGIAAAILKIETLKFVWVQGYKATASGKDLMPMNRASWRVEFIPEGEPLDGVEQPVQFIAYKSLSETRTDNPPTVICLSSGIMEPQ